jgi:hypothetical protein
MAAAPDPRWSGAAVHSGALCHPAPPDQQFTLSVRAAGRTPSELEGEIGRRLVSGGILLHPDVSVQIAEHRSSVVAVMGSVERPGLYPLTRPGATIAEFIWAAGGPNKDAGRLVEFTPASGQAAHGLVIEDTLDAINCITGKASPDVIQKLRAEPEVTDVSDIVPVQLPPKASPITW